MAVFLVNGQQHELRIIGENGIDYSLDFIGNTEHGMERDEDGRFIATPEDLKWWETVMAQHEEMERLIKNAENTYGYDVVHGALTRDGALDSDMDMMLGNVQRTLETLGE